MFGVFRNSVRLTSKPYSLPRLSNVFSGGNAGGATKYACLQCNNSNTVAPSWLQMSARCFGTLRTLVSSGLWKRENAGLLNAGEHNSDVTGSENSAITLGGGAFYIQSRGMKFKGRVKRRCKDCYFMWINGMLYNLCKTHPRHKHGLKPAYYANQRLLTHATMSPKRPW